MSTKYLFRVAEKLSFKYSALIKRANTAISGEVTSTTNFIVQYEYDQLAAGLDVSGWIKSTEPQTILGGEVLAPTSQFVKNLEELKEFNDLEIDIFIHPHIDGEELCRKLDIGLNKALEKKGYGKSNLTLVSNYIAKNPENLEKWVTSIKKYVEREAQREAEQEDFRESIRREFEEKNVINSFTLRDVGDYPSIEFYIDGIYDGMPFASSFYWQGLDPTYKTGVVDIGRDSFISHMFPLWDYSEKFRGEPSNYHSKAIRSSISELIKNYLDNNPEMKNSINTIISDKKDEYEKQRYNKKETMREPAIEPEPAAEIIPTEEEVSAIPDKPSLWNRFVSKVLG